MLKQYSEFIKGWAAVGVMNASEFRAFVLFAVFCDAEGITHIYNEDFVRLCKVDIRVPRMWARRLVEYGALEVVAWEPHWKFRLCGPAEAFARAAGERGVSEPVSEGVA